MNIQTIIYPSKQERLGEIKRLLATLASQQITVTVVHPGITAAKKLESALGIPVLGGYDLTFAPVESNSLLVVDGDLLSARHLKRLEDLGKDLYVLVPPDVLPPVGAGNVLRDILKPTGVNFPELSWSDELPRTFGCRHRADSCVLCEGSVLEFKANRRGDEAHM